MKHFIVMLLLCFAVAQLSAQSDCRPYLPNQVGDTWELTHYNAKGKEEGSSTYELVDVKTVGNKTTFNVKFQYQDKKGKEVMTSEYEAVCENGRFEIDMDYMMNPALLASYEGMEMTMDASSMELPSFDASAGTQLEDGNIKIDIAAMGGMDLNMEIIFMNRTVDGKEKKTTSAGTFDCLVMSQDVEVKTIMKMKTSSKDWIAENVGVVRTESYNKNGKLTGYTELTSISKK